MGQIVLSLGASQVTARHEEQRRSMIDHESADVLRPSGAGSLLDHDLQAGEVGDLLAKLLRLVLPAASLGEAQRRLAVPSGHHRNQRNHWAGPPLAFASSMAQAVRRMRLPQRDAAWPTSWP
jgi:hypothetical protein